MPTIYTSLAYDAWFLIFFVWFIGYFRTKKTVSRPQMGKYFLTTVLLVVSFLLLFSRHNPGMLDVQMMPQDETFGMTGVTIAFLGALFAVWARVTLGTNWSGTVATVKKDHELVQSGPYALARHPIYTGFLITMVGTALTVGTVASVIICAVAFFLRIQLEETVMTKHFPKEYPAYKKRTKALIPLVW